MEEKDPEIERALAILGKSGRIGSDRPPTEIIPTSSHIINDWLLQVGGFPRGRAIELYSATSVGKSTFAQWVAGEVQRQEFKLEFTDGTSIRRRGTVCWFDAEGTLMKDYATSSGMTLDRVVMPSFGLGNDFRHKLKQAVASEAFDLIVIDSIQAIQPDDLSEISGGRNMRDKLSPSVFWNQTFQELVGGFEIRDADGKLIYSKHPEYVYEEDETKEGKTQRLHKLEHKKCVLIFINHARTKIQTGFNRSRGSKTYTPGGVTKDFLYSIRLELRQKAAKTGKVKGDRQTLRYKEVEFRVAKHKLGVPLRTASLFLGIDGRLMLDESDISEIQIDIPPDEEEDKEDSLSGLKDKLRSMKGEDDDDSIGDQEQDSEEESEEGEEGRT